MVFYSTQNCHVSLLLYFISSFFSLFTLVGQKSVQATTEKVEFKCPSGYGNGVFADPASCRRFYQVSFRQCQWHTKYIPLCNGFYLWQTLYIKFCCRAIVYLFFLFLSWNSNANHHIDSFKTHFQLMGRILALCVFFKIQLKNHDNFRYTHCCIVASKCTIFVTWNVRMTVHSYFLFFLLCAYK